MTAMENILRALANRKRTRGLCYSAGQPATPAELDAAELRLRVTFPSDFRGCYAVCNGLHVEEPALTLLGLDQMEFAAAERLHFATFAADQKVCFDTSGRNVAGEWSIIGPAGDLMTLTFGSFVANKIFKWIDRRPPMPR